MKVLLTTDGSQHAMTALVSASRLLSRRDLQIDVLCVAPELVLEPAPGEASLGRSRIRESYTQRLTVESKQIVLQAEEALRREGIKTTPLFEFGSPADEILKLASDYDLVVVGAHGKYERKQPGLGPVSSRVIQSARSTVMVGRDLVNEANYRALVALDTSDASFNALRALSTYFDASSLDVTLMHVLETPWARLDQTESWANHEAEASAELTGYERELERELRRDAEAIIERGLLQLEEWRISATTIMGEGDAALELTSNVEEGNYDLVIVGATGSSDMRHALLGSVSLKLAWNSPCSVVVVRA
jgi:nucleotide-binding universal stress UspA family protein